MNYPGIKKPKLIWERNMFDYESIKAEYDRRIDLIIKMGNGRTREARLPKNHIDLFRRDKQVSIPEWLCELEGLV